MSSRYAEGKGSLDEWDNLGDTVYQQNIGGLSTSEEGESESET